MILRSTKVTGVCCLAIDLLVNIALDSPLKCTKQRMLLIVTGLTCLCGCRFERQHRIALEERLQILSQSLILMSDLMLCASAEYWLKCHHVETPICEFVHMATCVGMVLGLHH